MVVFIEGHYDEPQFRESMGCPFMFYEFDKKCVVYAVAICFQEVNESKHATIDMNVKFLYT